MDANVFIVVGLGLCPISEASSFSFAMTRIEGIPEFTGERFISRLAATGRTPSSRVGSIMALLAVLEEAEILPPEGTSQANQLIHGLIQLQAAFLNSSSPELASYLKAAERQWILNDADREYESLVTAGLTSRALEALILHDRAHSMWEDQAIVEAMREFNVTNSDWVLIVDIVNQAESVFHGSGRLIHELYDQWRVKMPGGKS